ncbi:MAG TPA: TonB-dependent receptor plug domain-containing protein, partial [Candidatus Goldiibacteriota bacterium]|nr:TonB-dependent receptor plug domain-containing protein [Candidatus Goldiibacteriota bacterium]
MKKLVILVILISISAMPAYSMMEITVEAENPVKAYTRVLGQEELNLLKPADTADAIKSLTEINVISRGLGTVQGDIIISAGTYEQAAVTLDGVRINDPQTGHYSADIPVTSLDTASVSINTG